MPLFIVFGLCAAGAFLLTVLFAVLTGSSIRKAFSVKNFKEASIGGKGVRGLGILLTICSGFATVFLVWLTGLTFVITVIVWVLRALGVPI